MIDELDGRPNPLGMFCDPVFPVLRIHGTMEQMNASLELDKVNQWARCRAESGTEHSPDKMAATSISQGAKELQSALVHEEDHLRRQYSTSYGLMQAYLNHQFLWKTSGALHSHLVNDTFTQSPLLPTLGSILKADGAQQYESYSELNQAEQYATLAVANLELQKLLEGASDSSGYPLAELLLAQWAEAGFFGKGGTYEWMNRKAVADIVAQRGHWFRFGGLQIFEHFAVLHQMERLRLLNAETQSVWKQFANSTRIYLTVLRRWQISVGPQEAAKFTDEQIFLHGLGPLPIEHFAMLDLAMWPPFVPQAEVLQGRAWRWSDINPWLRWERMLAIWENQGRRMTSIDSADCNEIFRDFQRQMCQELVWPTTDSLARAWLHWFQADLPREENPLLSPFWEPTLKTGLELLHLRRHRPFDAALGKTDATEGAKIRFSVWGHQAEQQGKVDFTTVRGDGSEVLEKYLLAKTTRWLANESGVFRELTDTRKKQGIDLLMSVFEVDKSNLAKERFLKVISDEAPGAI